MLSGAQEATYVKIVENVKIDPLLSENHIFTSPGPPKTVPKSIKRRSQEPSMLKCIFSTQKNASGGPGRPS